MYVPTIAKRFVMTGHAIAARFGLSTTRNNSGYVTKPMKAIHAIQRRFAHLRFGSGCSSSSAMDVLHRIDQITVPVPDFYVDVVCDLGIAFLQRLYSAEGGQFADWFL